MELNLDLLDKCYKGKNVFITGHTGFKGSWLVSWLHLLGANIHGYALAPENINDNYNKINGDSLCNSILADIRDKEKLKSEILNIQPDFIFHLAAQPLVRFSYESPVETFETNIIGTANVLDAVRYLDKPCNIILITTDKVYENKEWHYPYRESDRLGGYDPYSASKAAAEIIIDSYRNSFFNKNKFDGHHKSIASVRAGNVIGGGDWSKDRIVPDIIKALSQNEVVTIRNPNAIRPWQHVLEPLNGYLKLGAKMDLGTGEFNEAWNFGPFLEDTLTVKDFVKISIKKWGKGEFQTPELSNQPHEAEILKLDINKTIKMLGWKPIWNADKAIEKTIEWYKNMNASITFNQIKEFQTFDI